MPKRDIPHITCEHLYTLHGATEKKHVVVDLRERLDYEAGHIKDSFNVPRKELETNIESVIPEKSHKVIVVVGPTQEVDVHEVEDILNELGYSNVEFLNGGFDRWCEIAPLEIEEGLLEMTPEEQGLVGDGDPTEIDPEKDDNEPLY